MKIRKKIACFCLSVLLLLAAFPVGNAFAADTRTFIAFGDSITASGAWFSRAEKQFGIKFINRAYGGWNSNQGRAAFANVLQEKPDVLLLSFGMNDAALDMDKHVPPDRYRENMAYMIEKGQEAGATVILIIENPIDETPYYTRHDKTVFEPYGGANNYYAQYVECALELANHYGLLYADLYTVFRETGKAGSYIADGIHPNAAGYELYAKELCAALTALNAGDLDENGKINASDYLLLKRVVMKTSTVQVDAARADVDGNGKVNASDYFLLKRCILRHVKPYIVRV